MSAEQGCYTLIGRSPNTKGYTDKKIKADLESQNIAAKTSALKEVIRMLANGESIPGILITVIRFVMPCSDHMIKKLLFVFWEIVPKYGQDGKLLHEMILVCDAYRKDLQHPNEYIRGCTLRFLCKLKEPELLEPLMPTIQQCLEHRHSYVRRNAVLAVYTIYKNFDNLFPDAPSRILQFLEEEQDATCKRNAFIMLTHVSQSSALEYLSTCLDEVPSFDEILQLVVVELIYKVCLSHPNERGRFIACVYSLLQSNSASVRYEAAGTLTTLSNAPTAIKAVASCYIDLILKESDNNVKLIVMDRLVQLRLNNERIMQDMIMEVVKILSASDLELKEKTLEFISDLVTSRTVKELVGLLQKEVLKTTSENAGKSEVSKKDSKSSIETSYTYALIHNLFDIVTRFPSTISDVVPTLCDVLCFGENNDTHSVSEICCLLREIIHQYPDNKELIIEKLMQVLPNIEGLEPLCRILWILGEFCKSGEEIANFMSLIHQILGDIPLVEKERKRLSNNQPGGDNSDEKESALLASDGGLSIVGKGTSTRVTADGTYVTETALDLSQVKASSNTVQRPILQAALFESEYLAGVVLSVCLVKVFRNFSVYIENQYSGDEAKISQRKNAFVAEAMLIISSMIHLAKSGLLQNHINPDHLDRMWICLKILSDGNDSVLEAFDAVSRLRLSEMIESQAIIRKNVTQLRRTGHSAQKAEQERERNRPDAPVKFRLLSGRGQSDWLDVGDRFDLTLSQALGSDKDKTADLYTTSKLSKVHQLTGFSDPVYAEAYVNVNQFNIMLDMLVVNQTSDTLQNLTVELSTLGDLKLIERPSPITLAAQDFTNIKACIKVSSTVNGMIFGNIVYDVRGSSGECNCVVLNDIHIDIIEYIVPTTCSMSDFRQMWSDFEWENKVTVSTQISDLRVYLAHITQCTNLLCLTPKEAMEGECDYLCVTLYARSIFGEHVLANLCLEKCGPDQPVTGHARIRAKTQGMAVTMGDKVSTCQKLPVSPELLKDLVNQGVIKKESVETPVQQNSSDNPVKESESNVFGNTSLVNCSA